ncbi:MAG TPA: hypothetical protein VKM72_28405 [Thermoanaerobaculia bacterium]|nr:hypothetical protein [Thermoanaerobaculia bacterium]
MKQRTPGQRRALVEEVEEFRNWALSERVAEESVATAPSSPPKALELAQLAVQIAELLPGEDWLRCRTQGYAWFHVSNAHKASGDFGDADAALVKARTLWAAGAPGKPGFLSEAIALALEAKLHQSRRRFHLGLQRIDEALAADTGELKARLLLNKAQILDALGNTETASAVLREAVSYIDEQQDPRAALGVRFQFLLNLCLAGRAREAAPGLRVVRALAEKVGQGLDVSRVEWLTGKIAAGCSQAKEAETAFEQARKEFASSDPPLAFDYALVSLDLALLLLEQNRTSEVRPLAEQTVNLFRRYGIQREALAALQIYCEAAKREDATVELTRQVIRFLHRSQHDPELTFNGNEPGTEGQR